MLTLAESVVLYCMTYPEYAETCIETYGLTPAEYEQHIKDLEGFYDELPPFEFGDEVSEELAHDVIYECCADMCC